MSDPYQNQYPGPGYPPPPGAPGGFAPVAGQPPYGGGFGAPPMPGFPAPGGQPYYQAPAGFPSAGPPPPAQQYGAPAGFPPPPGGHAAPGGFAPPGGPPPGAPGAGYAPAYPFSEPPAGAAYHPGYAPPVSSYGAPPNSSSYGAPPPAPSPYGAPPAPSPYGMPSTMPSAMPQPPTVLYRGILTLPGFTTKEACDAIVRYAGNDDQKLIDCLVGLGPLKLELVARDFRSPKRQETLHNFLERKTSGSFETCLLGLVLGPIKYDADRLKVAIKGAGTDETVLNEILLDLTPEDVALLACVYKQRYAKSLLQAVQEDLSGGVRTLFTTLLTVPDGHNASVVHDTKPPVIEDDIRALRNAGPSRIGTNETTIYKILTGRTHAQLMEICRFYPTMVTTQKSTPTRKTLSHDLKSEFSGHGRNALLHLVAGAEVNPKYADLDPMAVRDAMLLEASMTGLGTNDELLIMRILRAHWHRPRMDAIAVTYSKTHKNKTLKQRVKGETSGPYKKLLVALIGKQQDD
ncbi:hypothetical protein C8R47DRAFT_243088 [Mycena vitilis]|nr:hypothetical protein C8R47DRAFT_243088 [Mycena vitilis]